MRILRNLLVATSFVLALTAASQAQPGPYACSTIAEQCEIFGGDWAGPPGGGYECDQDGWYLGTCWNYPGYPNPIIVFCCLDGHESECSQCSQPTSSYDCQVGGCQ